MPIRRQETRFVKLPQGQEGRKLVITHVSKTNMRMSLMTTLNIVPGILAPAPSCQSFHRSYYLYFDAQNRILIPSDVLLYCSQSYLTHSLSKGWIHTDFIKLPSGLHAYQTTGNQICKTPPGSGGEKSSHHPRLRDKYEDVFDDHFEYSAGHPCACPPPVSHSIDLITCILTLKIFCTWNKKVKPTSIFPEGELIPLMLRYMFGGMRGSMPNIGYWKRSLHTHKNNLKRSFTHPAG